MLEVKQSVCSVGCHSDSSPSVFAVMLVFCYSCSAVQQHIPVIKFRVTSLKIVGVLGRGGQWCEGIRGEAGVSTGSRAMQAG